jgi:hypothetical protein
VASVIRTVAKVAAIVTAALAAVVAVIAILLVGVAYLVFQPSRDEVARVASPDGKVVATLMEVNGGATTSFGYEVHLATPGAFFGETQVASLYGAVRNASAYGVNLRWNSDSELSVEYLSAKNAELEVPEWRNAGSRVQVTLKAGVEDPSAPPGGMLYNLRH